jgi:hypothetical protein
MNGDEVRLRLVRRRDRKVVRQWTAPIAPDDRDALDAEFVTGVRAQMRSASDREAKVFAPDYWLEFFARVGGWTRFRGRSNAES